MRFLHERDDLAASLILRCNASAMNLQIVTKLLRCRCPAGRCPAVRILYVFRLAMANHCCAKSIDTARSTLTANGVFWESWEFFPVSRENYRHRVSILLLLEPNLHLTRLCNLCYCVSRFRMHV